MPTGYDILHTLLSKLVGLSSRKRDRWNVLRTASKACYYTVCRLVPQIPAVVLNHRFYSRKQEMFAMVMIILSQRARH